MSRHDMHALNGAQQLPNPKILEEWSRPHKGLRNRLIVEGVWYWNEGLRLTYKGRTVTLKYREAWDLPYKQIVAERDELKRFLARATFCELWFSVEDLGDVIPDNLDEDSIEDLKAAVAEIKTAYAHLRGPVALDWREIVRDAKLPVRPYVTNSVPQGKRSDVIWKIARMCVERGCTSAETAAVVAASEAWQSKHGNNDRALQRLIDKATRHVRER